MFFFNRLLANLNQFELTFGIESGSIASAVWTQLDKSDKTGDTSLIAGTKIHCQIQVPALLPGCGSGMSHNQRVLFPVVPLQKYARPISSTSLPCKTPHFAQPVHGLAQENHKQYFNSSFAVKVFCFWRTWIEAQIFLIQFQINAS